MSDSTDDTTWLDILLFLLLLVGIVYARHKRECDEDD